MLKEIIIGVAGVAIGFAGATLLWKNKYEKEAREEVESMREYVNELKAEGNVGKVEFDRKEAVGELKEKIEPYSKAFSHTEVRDLNDIYEIPEEDFVMEDENFDKVSLEYYADSGDLYEGAEIVGDINSVIGSDILNKLHGIGSDVLYVRNENLETDYEVIKIEGAGPER